MTRAQTFELVSNGIQEIAFFERLLERADATLWRTMHMKITIFVLQPQVVNHSSSSIKWGSKVQFTFPKSGDLAWHLFSVVDIPGIVGVDTTNKTILTGVQEPFWTNAIGQYLHQQVQLFLGGTEITSLYNHFMFASEELCGMPGKALTEMIGKYDSPDTRKAMSRRAQRLYVPLSFYFTKNPGMALPIASLQYHHVMIKIQFSDLISSICIEPVNGDVPVADIYIREPGATNAQLQAQIGADGRLASAKLIDSSDLDAELLFMCVYLDADERSKFAHGNFEVVIEEVQESRFQQSGQVSTTNQETATINWNVRPTFSNIVQEYIFMFQRDESIALNNHFDYSGWFDTLTGTYQDPIRHMGIFFINQARVEMRDPKFYRLVQPWMHHTRIPRQFIYCWNYCVDPQDVQVTGGCNHSRIDTVEFRFQLDSRCFLNNNSMHAYIYAVNRNILRFKAGMVALRFNS